ncbi:hypothetical protein [Microbacterium rhizomatis]|uniref:Asp23/Gls24 family envelope stress response protein n=1 Tax=Microbacterium rhizomatis TaxID=1631477 RepID=A0A5J5J2G5_9MICO|nr:hypothetical protein [Microbacterium rhizomatis]KAA9106498.1 hypothetical protein F6B43_15285 [Microbacterium rhizomatis]
MSIPQEEPTGLSPDVALTHLVRNVDGVTDVFTPSIEVAHLPGLVTALVTGDADALNRVRVRSTPESTDIATRIAIDVDASTPATAREVASALLASAPPGAEVTISVEVSRIS